jgi:transcriptional regulator with XRE-family HTH domain
LDIGKQLRKARRARGLTQEELARRANMSLNGLAQLEQGGRTDPHYSTLNKLATALDMSVAEFLEYERPLERAPFRGSRVEPGSLVSLGMWLEEHCGHAHLALPRDDFEAMFDELPEDSSERRTLALEVNEEYNVFCRFPKNVTPEQRVAMRKIIRDAIPEVAVKHVIALQEGALDRAYQEEAALIFEMERAIEQGTA